MLTAKYIEDNSAQVIELLKIKNFDANNSVAKVLELNKKRKETQASLDKGLAEQKIISSEIGKLFKSGKVEEANEAKKRSAELKEETKELNSLMSKAEKQLHDVLITIPNLPHHSVKQGKGAIDNEEIRSGGQNPVLSTNSFSHWDIAKEYDLIDFELGNKITGSGFPVYKGMGAKFQRALISFFLDEAIKAGYKEIMPPLMVNSDSAYGTGQLPDKDGQMYHVEEDELYLIPTSEVPLTNIFRDTILENDDFPVKLTAYTPCFRREAGSYGKDVRGLNRLHQFDKVEIVRVERPEDSYDALDKMVNYVEGLINKLELPYRIMRLCGGDLSFTSALTFDFEVYSAGQERWLEVSSVSNFEDFQANRLKLRYRKTGEKKPAIAHTLNGSALALPRILAALLENNQTTEGIKIPAALQDYVGCDIISK